MVIAKWLRRLTAMRSNDWTGCIDFGTAYSKFAMVRAEETDDLGGGDIRPMAIGKGVSLNPYLLPSLIFVDQDVVLFGRLAEQAAVRAERQGRSAFVSPKQYLSTHDPVDFDSRLEPEIDPTGSYTPRQLITLYLAYLIKRAEAVAGEEKLPWPARMRIARPAWQADRAAWGEAVLRQMVRHAFIIVDQLEDRIVADAGLSHADAKEALALTDSADISDEQIFRISSRDTVTVTEATAVAAGSIRPKRRRVVVVVDIGGGTSDFAAFMTGLANRNVVAEIEGSSTVLRKAGDHLDMQLRRLLLEEAGILDDDPAGRGASNRIRSRQRSLKEALFNDGKIAVEVGDTFVELSAEQLLNDEKVQRFTAELRDQFYVALDRAIECAKMFSTASQRVPVEIMATGGGWSLPMVRAMLENVERSWSFLPAAPDLFQPKDVAVQPVIRQLTVSIGGAVLDLPAVTSPVRLS